MAENLKKATVTGPNGEHEEETIVILAHDLGDGIDPDEWRYVVTAKLVGGDGDELAYEGFDIPEAALECHQDLVRRFESEHRDNEVTRREEYAEAVLDLSEDFRGVDGEFVELVASLIAKGKGREAMAAIRASGLA